MEKKIPIYFDTIILDSPAQEVSLNAETDIGNGSRLEVGVFTKYKNRNGSYITDEYAAHLIESATRGDTPVVGFFDPSEQQWASHTGPTLANGYGYIESFLGWRPFTDTDGITRDYATFSVVIFSKYYEEARKIRGQNQSMELDERTIQGDWANFDGEEYFVYTQGDMLGLCVIGAHEPCFSVSHFFSKNDDAYKSQYEKFSSLLSGLKAQVEEAEKNIKGGEQPMENFENNEVVNPTPEVVEPEVKEEENTPDQFQNEEPTVEEPAAVEEPVAEEPAEPSEFEVLQQQFQDLQTSYNALQEQFSAAESRIAELEQFQSSANEELDALRAKNTELQTAVSNYEAAEVKAEEARKEELVKSYEKYLDEEEIAPIKDMVKDFSYEALEGKLAITFAKKQMVGSEEVKKIPLPEPENDDFANFMKKYKK